jgi:hypothetical protein
MPTQLEELKKTLARLEAKGGPDNAFRQGLRSQIDRLERKEKGAPHRPNPMDNPGRGWRET